MPPSVLQALRLSARAVAGALWLGPVALALAVAGQLAGAPAGLFAAALAGRGFEAGALGGTLESALGGALVALASPRGQAIGLGLWLAGLLLRGALRVAWLSGALPTVGEGLSGRGAPAFAAGLAWGFPRLLGTALLGFLLELAAGLTLAGALLAAVLGGVALAGQGAGLLAAALVAGGVVSAIALWLGAGLLADAAVARTALRGEGPRRAFVAAAVRLGGRPAAFLALALLAGVASLAVAGAVDAALGAGLRLAAARAHPALLAAPQLLAWAAGAMLAALLELWRLGAVATLACHRAPGDP
jgi:hypothetical protein